MKPTKLIYKDMSSAGKHIYAHIDNDVSCVEYTMRNKLKPVVEPKSFIVGYEPWIQFEPTEWSEMQDILFQQMVDAWNEKYSDAKD